MGIRLKTLIGNNYKTWWKSCKTIVFSHCTVNGKGHVWTDSYHMKHLE